MKDRPSVVVDADVTHLPDHYSANDTLGKARSGDKALSSRDVDDIFAALGGEGHD
jgi:hypothetical protein